jgi:hypothetical protein
MARGARATLCCVEHLCEKCGLPHRNGKAGEKFIGRRRDGGCSFCGAERSRSSRLCRECHAAYMRGHRRRYRELSPEARAKDKARSYAGVCLRRGSIMRGNCIDCGSADAQMHHSDYSKPAEITWLCRGCHLAHHAAGEHIVPPLIVEDPNFVPRKLTGRSKTPPITTRLSPAERESFNRKAERAGLSVSAAARAAIEAWNPGEATAYMDATSSVQHSIGQDIRVVYDE